MDYEPAGDVHRVGKQRVRGECFPEGSGDGVDVVAVLEQGEGDVGAGELVVARFAGADEDGGHGGGGEGPGADEVAEGGG